VWKWRHGVRDLFHGERLVVHNEIQMRFYSRDIVLLRMSLIFGMAYALSEEQRLRGWL
jgi:hypothetical protein